jgi:hypothetical protein
MFWEFAQDEGHMSLSRSDAVLRFVRSRQRFVRRCHRGKKAPAIDGRGKLSRAELSGLFGPIRPAFTGRAERFFVARPTSWDLLICAKDLFGKAIDGKKAPAGRVGASLAERIEGRIRPFPFCIA